jgi:RND family efflux transporter MFP subunit
VRRRTAIAGSTLLAATGVGILALAVPRGEGAPTAAVQLEDFAVVVEAPGRLEAAVAYEMGPPSIPDVWRYNLSWMIPEGRTVAAGEVVARFDATEMEERLLEHRAALEKVVQEREKEQRNLEVSLRQLRLDLVKAEGEMKTVDLDLSVPDELLSSIEIGQLKLRRTLAARRVEFLGEKIEFEQDLVRAKLELLDVKRSYEEAKVAYYESARDKFAVKAPIAGLVVYVEKHDGGRWEIGESVWMMAKILQIADVSTLRVVANVLEVDAARIAPGQSAEIAVDAVPGLALTSTVAEVGRIVHERSRQDRSKVFDAMLPLGAAGEGDLIRPGMGVSVRIRTATLPGRLTVPLDAVRADDDGAWVEVVDRGSAARRPVTLGPRNGTRVVVESGLEQGERVRLFGERA